MSSSSSVLQALYQQLSGEIWATSSGKDQGSCFHFTIPIALNWDATD
jgi:signal transduction histidine kinase